MKTILFSLVLVALITFALTQNQPPPPQDQGRPVQNPRKCKRQVEINTNNKNNFIFNSVAGCAGPQGPGPKRAGALSFQLFSQPLPRFALRAFSKNGDNAPAFGVVFGLDRAVEYENTNGKEGFQGFMADVAVANYSMIGTQGKPIWGDLQYKTVKAADGTILYHTVTVSNQAPIFFADSITIGVKISPQEVSVPAGNSTAKRQVLTPNSFKLDIAVNGIKYTKSNTGLALGGFLITKKMPQRRQVTSRTTYADSDGDAPDTNNGDQHVADINDEADDTQKGGFFSWKTFVDARQKNGTAGVIPLINSDFLVDVTTDMAVVAEDKDRLVRRIWFSPQGRPNDILWDPSMGTAEPDTTSGASARFVSLTMGSIVAFVMFAIVLFL